MRRIASVHADVLAATGAVNSCVHTAVAAATVLSEAGHKVEAVVGDLTIAIPNVTPGYNRLISTAQESAPVHAPGSPGNGYPWHAWVMGQDGFLDLACTAVDPIDNPFVTAWEDVCFDWAFFHKNPGRDDFNLHRAAHGDIWGVESVASMSAVRGAGMGMIVSWALRDQEIWVHPHPMNLAAVERLTVAYRKVM